MNKQEHVGALGNALEALIQEEAEPMLRWFRFEHLPPHLAEISALFAGAAVNCVENLERSAERTVALRKLLEGKDAAVRAMVDQTTNRRSGISEPR